MAFSPLPETNNYRLHLLDIGPLFDEHLDIPGIYAAAFKESADGTWITPMLYMSCDGGTNYQLLTGLEEQAEGGYAMSALGDGPTSIVDKNADVETIWISGTPETVDPFRKCANNLIIGDEVMQFKTASLNAGRSYQLQEMWRGLKGTEAETNQHSIGDRVILLNRRGVHFIPINADLLSETLYFKLVPEGFELADVVAETLNPFEGKSLRPLSPVHLESARNASNHITYSWDRRTRAAFDPFSGYHPPLAEEQERYVVEVDDPVDATLDPVRTEIIEGTTEWEYTAADQTADGYTPGDAVTINVKQRGTWADSLPTEYTAPAA